MNTKTTKMRDTSATRLRMENMRSLIKEVGDRGTMMRDEICFFLGYSPSGGRKYIRELSDAGIIIAPTPEAGEQRVYKLNPDPVYIATALAAMCAPHAGPADPGGAQITGRVVLSTPGRHLHVMRDDVQYKIKTTFKIPPPDPLIAHLFGFAGGAA